MAQVQVVSCELIRGSSQRIGEKMMRFLDELLIGVILNFFFFFFLGISWRSLEGGASTKSRGEMRLLRIGREKG